MTAVNIHPSWQKVLRAQFEMDYFISLQNFLAQERVQQIVYPKQSHLFAAYNHCTFENTKVVVIGQDPYHGINQANGLAFSVSSKEKVPPSLKNIFKELSIDLRCSTPTTGDLTPWAQQGVLLLNTVLTVRHKSPGSHRNKGWEQFTTATLKALQQRKNLVYILWGAQAQEKKALIDKKQNLILEAPHPSPLSAYRGFFGSKPFSKTNSYLVENGVAPIIWQIL
jgi:uracil-DNA glycosylase